MSTSLLPQSFWFRLGLACRRLDDVPRTRGARLLGLPAECRLPDLATLDDRKAWAEVRMAWNATGLAVELTADGQLDLSGQADRVDDSHAVRLWIDTRDTRDVSRATRFCQSFEFRVGPPKGTSKSQSKATPVVTVRQRAIARAVAEAPPCDVTKIQTRLERLAQRWRLEIFLPSEVLHGFDPETNRRLGFMYACHDPLREDLFLGVGREFPVGENPSLWVTLELRDA